MKTRDKNITIDDLHVQVEWKRNKHMYLRVKQDGGILVTAPLRYTEETVVAFVRERRDWIAQQRAAQQKKRDRQRQLGERERTYLNECLPPMIAHWEQVLGVKVQSWHLRDMKTRWGSCTPSTGRIRFALMLAQVPLPCIEYVVLHELVHLLEPSHNQRFHALMTQYMPDWRARRRQMRQQGESM